MHELETKNRILFVKMETLFPNLENIPYWEKDVMKLEDYRICTKQEVFDKVDEVVSVVDNSLKSEDFSLEILDKLENAIDDAMKFTSYLFFKIID